MQKSVFIQVLIRDPENNITGSECASGFTEDEGVTCVVPLGYLSNIATAAPGDITLTVQPPPTITPGVEFVSGEDDTENNLRTIVLSLPA